MLYVKALSSCFQPGEGLSWGLLLDLKSSFNLRFKLLWAEGGQAFTRFFLIPPGAGSLSKTYTQLIMPTVLSPALHTPTKNVCCIHTIPQHLIVIDRVKAVRDHFQNLGFVGR